MKYLKYISESRFSKNLFDGLSISKTCNLLKINNYVINNDESIDVYEDVYLEGEEFHKLPLKFKEVLGSFLINNNNLKSLDGCPEIIGEDFDCSSNQLESLYGGPSLVNGGYFCNANNLENLDGCPEIVSFFDCSNNKLLDLSGGPIKVDRDYDCNNNLLTSLDGSPESCGQFNCSENRLTSLEGGPKSTSGILNCSFNKIKSFDGFPLMGSGEFVCRGNPMSEILSLNLKREFIEFLIEYDVIRDGNKIVESRLKQALEDSNGKIPKEFRFQNYLLI